MIIPTAPGTEEGRDVGTPGGGGLGLLAGTLMAVAPRAGMKLGA